MSPSLISPQVNGVNAHTSSAQKAKHIDENDLSEEPLDDLSVKEAASLLQLPAVNETMLNGDEEDEPPPLQVTLGEIDGLEPVDEAKLDPSSFDLVNSPEQTGQTRGRYKLEQRSDELFSRHHLQAIFDNAAELHRFSNFLRDHRPSSVPLLLYFLETLKALRAIGWSNHVVKKLQSLSDFPFTERTDQAQPASNLEVEAKADQALEILTREDLPMYITHVWMKTVSVSIKQKIMGEPLHVSEGLAEVFCLTDPSRHDNPIVFMSEEFNRTTQYGLDYVLGRNCRFLQGPDTNPFSVKRIRDRLDAGMEHYETFLNYRRDGSPFMNLVMLAPLIDSRGVIRYFIGAQIDVSGLAMSCYGLRALQQYVNGETRADLGHQLDERCSDEFTRVAEILGPKELEVVRDRGGGMHRVPMQLDAGFHSYEKMTLSKRPAEGGGGGGDHNKQATDKGGKHRVVLEDPETQRTLAANEGEEVQPQSSPATRVSLADSHNGRLPGVYEHYLLVRPYPSLRILFTSPSMRVPGILQSPLLDRIGGSSHMRDQLIEALSEGRGVTAKVKWLSGSQRRRTNVNDTVNTKTPHNQPLGVPTGQDNDADEDWGQMSEHKGRSRWLHCTPLMGANGNVGVWMIVIVDGETKPRIWHPTTPSTARAMAAATGRLRSGAATPAVEEDALSFNDEKYDNNNTDARRPRLSPRRSSETLGMRPARDLSKVDEHASNTTAVNRRHSGTSRTDNKPAVAAPSSAKKPSSIPSRFFDVSALSRASQTNGGLKRGWTAAVLSTKQRFQSNSSDNQKRNLRELRRNSYGDKAASSLHEGALSSSNQHNPSLQGRAVVTGEANSIHSQSSGLTVQIRSN